MDYSPPGSSVHGILQAKILEWVPLPFPGDLPSPGIKPKSPELQEDSLPLSPQGTLHQNYSTTQKRVSFTTGEILRNSHAEGERGLLLSTEALC